MSIQEAIEIQKQTPWFIGLCYQIRNEAEILLKAATINGKKRVCRLYMSETAGSIFTYATYEYENSMNN